MQSLLTKLITKFDKKNKTNVKYLSILLAQNESKNWPNVIPKYKIGHRSNKNVGKSRQPSRIKICIFLTQWEFLSSFIIGKVTSVMRLGGVAFEGWNSELIRRVANGATEIVRFGFGFVEGKGLANWVAFSIDNRCWNRMKGTHPSNWNEKLIII